MHVHNTYPKVLLVGRTNVGKSTLFNRLVCSKKSITFEREGVTRDYISDVISWDDKKFLLIDTGGFDFSKKSDPIISSVQQKVHLLIEEAALLLFVVDGRNGLTQSDMTIARKLRKTKKPVFLIINKTDCQKSLANHEYEFNQLGIEHIINTSGIHNIGMNQLLDSITAIIPTKTKEISVPQYKITIIGKPNVGKSSLMNLLIKHERSIVSEIAGTTREAISELLYSCNDLIQLTDTAGVRRSRKVDDDLEQLMVKSSLESVREANIVLMVIDASSGNISDQELKLLFYAYEQKKMIILLFNKIDLLTDYTEYTIQQTVAQYAFILNKIPQLWISCVTKKNIGKIFQEIKSVWSRSKQQIDPVELDIHLKLALEPKHLVHNKVFLKVAAIKQLDAPMPLFCLSVNHPLWFDDSVLACIENILRQKYDFLGCPIKFVLRAED